MEFWGVKEKVLGKPLDGPDDIRNIICLCPKHHDQFDASLFYIDVDTLEIKGLAGFEGKKLNLSKKHKLLVSSLNMISNYMKRQNIYDGRWNKVCCGGVDSNSYLMD